MSELPKTLDVLEEVYAERERQQAKWGEQNHPDGTGSLHHKHAATEARRACNQAADEGYITYAHILDEEVQEAFAESDSDKLREELVQVAAVAVAWVEAIDRRESAGLDKVSPRNRFPVTAPEPSAALGSVVKPTPAISAVDRLDSRGGCRLAPIPPGGCPRDTGRACDCPVTASEAK